MAVHVGLKCGIMQCKSSVPTAQRTHTCFKNQPFNAVWENNGFYTVTMLRKLALCERNVACLNTILGGSHNRYGVLNGNT